MALEISPFELELLWCGVLGISRASLRAHPEFTLNKAAELQVNQWVARRKQGEPMAYILGQKEFWSLPLKVNQDVLIPRPETELLVQTVLEKLPKESHQRVLDLGTGSGAIALALAHERPNWQIVAVDQSEKALALAKENAKLLSISNVDFDQSDWFAGVSHHAGLFDAIVSNPPYIPKNDPHLNVGDCRFEPMEALKAGPEGLDDLKHIISKAHNYLAPKGWLLVEHGYDQGARVMDLFQKHGFKNILGVQDLAGHNRVVTGNLP